METRPLFEIKDLRFSYAQKRGGSSVLALSIAALAIQPGERILLRGPNGSGKTSLLKLLNALLEPSSGEVLFRGVAVSSSSELRNRSVYLHQNPLLLSGPVSYNVAFGCRRDGLSKEAIAERVRSQLSRVGLEGFARRRSRALSGGEAQRVALARALATGADVLLLDEPTASVDADSALLIRRVLDEEAARGATILVSTHDEALAADLGGRTLRFENGTIIGDEARGT